VLLTLALSFAPLQAQRDITIGIEGVYKPWGFAAHDGTLVGMEIELVELLCKKMQTKCTLEAHNWNGLIPSLMSGKFDVVVGLSINSDRRRVINFTDPYALDPSGFIVLKDSSIAALIGSKFEEINMDTMPKLAESVIEQMRSSLKGLVIGAQVGTANMAFLKKYFSDLVRIREYDTIEQHNIDLRSKRIDAIFAHKHAVFAPAKLSDIMQDFTLAGPTFSGGVLGVGIGAGIRKGDTELAKALNNAIASAISKKQLKELFVKWFGADLSPPQRVDIN